MKNLVLASSLLFAGAAFAQEEPAPTPPPTPRDLQIQIQKAQAEGQRLAQRRFIAARAGKLEKGTWLGISSGPLPSELRQKLALPRGLGLQVAQVEAGSPAEKAGMAAQDVLVRVNDQQLFNEAQLRSLIRTFKAGDEVKLNIIRGDQPMSLAARLLEREVPATDDLVFSGITQLMGGGGAMGVAGGGAMAIAGGPGRVENMTRVDADGVTIQMHGDANGRHLKAIGADGKVLFDGPIDTEELRKALPADIRKRVEEMGMNGNPPANFIVPGNLNANALPQPGMPLTNFTGYVTIGDGNREQKIDWSDGDVDLTLTIKRNGKEVATHLLVKDDTGKKLFEGPVDTREQRGDVPVNLQDKLLQALLKNFQEAGGTLNPIRIRLDKPAKE